MTVVEQSARFRMTADFLLEDSTIGGWGMSILDFFWALEIGSYWRDSANRPERCAFHILCFGRTTHRCGRSITYGSQ